MNACGTVFYVAGATAVVVLVGWLVGRWRSRKYRPGRAGPDPRLAEAQRRYEAGEITESELPRIEEHVFGR